MAKKNNFEKAMETLKGAKSGDNRLPPIPCGGTIKDTDEKQQKRTLRRAKHKGEVKRNWNDEY